MKANHVREGDVFPTNDGGKVIVLECLSSREITVEHQDSHLHWAVVRATNLREGKIKNPYHPVVFGVGYMGYGKHSGFVNGKPAPAYDSWARMLKRCYDPAYHNKQPTYVGCSVADEWHNFQVYAEWYYGQPNGQNPDFQLDKDLRIGGNKQYGPDACSFVPQQINILLADHAASRGDLPQGVVRKGNSFQVRLSVNGKLTYLGIYPTPEQAFAVYKTAKEENVKTMAEEWKDWIHPEVYNYLMVWKVDE